MHRAAVMQGQHVIMSLLSEFALSQPAPLLGGSGEVWSISLPIPSTKPGQQL